MSATTSVTVPRMAADLFETYAVTIIGELWSCSAMLDALETRRHRQCFVLYPLVLVGIAIIATMIGTFFVKTSDGNNIMRALYQGGISAVSCRRAGMWIAFYGITQSVDGITNNSEHYPNPSGMRLWGTAVVGLALTPFMVWITETLHRHRLRKPAQDVALRPPTTGHATNIIAGIGKGYQGARPPGRT